MTLAEIDAELETVRAALAFQAKNGRASQLEDGRATTRTEHADLMKREQQLVRMRNNVVSRSAGAGSLGGLVSRIR